MATPHSVDPKESSESLRSRLLDRVSQGLSSRRNQKLALSAALFISGLSTLAIIAIAIYSVFYATYIPPLIQDQPVYLDYDQSPPAFKIDLQDSHHYSSKLLMLDQEYIFSVKLTVPDSAHNFKVGNFMVHLALVSEKNRTLADVSRPALLQYKSPLLRSMQTVLRVFPLIFNYASEVQSIQKNRAKWAIVSISNRDLHVHSVKLSIETSLRGLRFFMYHWYYSTALLMSSIIMLWEIVIVYYGWQYFLSSSLYRSLYGIEGTSQKKSRKGTRSSKVPTSGESLDDTTLGDEGEEDDDFEDIDEDGIVGETLLTSSYLDETPIDAGTPWTTMTEFSSSLSDTQASKNLATQNLQKKSSGATLRMSRQASYQFEAAPFTAGAYDYTFKPNFSGQSRSGEPEVLEELSAEGENYSVPFSSIPVAQEPPSLDLDKLESVNHWRESLTVSDQTQVENNSVQGTKREDTKENAEARVVGDAQVHCEESGLHRRRSKAVLKDMDNETSSQTNTSVEEENDTLS